MKIVFTVNEEDASAVSTDLVTFYPDVKWVTKSFDANGTPVKREAEFSVTFATERFFEFSEIIERHFTTEQLTTSNRIRNVMAKNVQHGMRVEYPGGAIAEVNSWVMDSRGVHIGSQGGHYVAVHPDKKIRVHPD